MSNPTFEVRALWDEEAGVWISESDIVGLHIEAETMEEFEAEVRLHAAQLIVENHYDEADIERSQLKDLIPAIYFRAGKPGRTAA